MRFHLATAALIVAGLAGACSTDTPVTTTTTPAPLATLQLSGDGLGDVKFGLDPGTVVADISALYGEPDHDSGWILSEPNVYGSCPGETMRAIGWGSLVAIFINDQTSDLGGWFYAWTYGYDYSANAGGVDPRDTALNTPLGIGLGSTLAELMSAYQSDLEISGDEILDVWAFTAAEAGYRGLLSGGDSTDMVTLIESVTGCGT